MTVLFDSQTSILFTQSLVVIIAFLVTEAADFHIAVLGETFTLRCNATRPSTEVIWQFNHQDIGHYTERNDRYHVDTDDRRLTFSLEIQDVKFYDAGDYTCIHSFRGEHFVGRVYTLQITGNPTLKLSENESIENDTILAKCCLKIGLAGRPMTLLWFIGKQPLTAGNRTQVMDRKQVYEVEVCSTIYFQSIRYFHDLSLTCVVPDPFNISTSRKIKVLYSGGVRMLMTSHIITMSKKKEVKVICQGEGNPQPVVKLQKKIDHVWWESPIKGTLIERKGCNTTWLFHFYNTSNEMTGTYRCAGSNSLGGGYSTETVQVVDIHRQGTTTAIYVLLCVAVITLLIFVVAKTDKCFSLTESLSKFTGSKDNAQCTVKMTKYDSSRAHANTVQETTSIDESNHLYAGSNQISPSGSQYTKLISKSSKEHSNGHLDNNEKNKTEGKRSSYLEVISEIENSDSGPHYHTIERASVIQSTYYEGEFRKFDEGPNKDSCAMKTLVVKADM